MFNPRQITAVHEAGHAVIAEHSGIRVKSLEIINFQTGSTELDTPDPPPHEKLVQVAVAGFVAVGSAIGAKAEAQNRAMDAHEEPGSDLFRAMEHALELGVAIEALHDFLTAAEATVRAILDGNPFVGMLIAISEDLWDEDPAVIPLDRMSGDQVRHYVEKTRDEWIRAGSPE